MYIIIQITIRFALKLHCCLLSEIVSYTIIYCNKWTLINAKLQWNYILYPHEYRMTLITNNIITVNIKGLAWGLSLITKC